MIPTPGKKIRVMVVDDSILARSLLIKGLSSHPNIEVVGYAINTMDARNKFSKLNPDVMTMDVEMPGMDGISFLKQFLPENPVPVILVSSLNLKVFDALSAGAVDFVRKPDKEGQEAFIETLNQKVIAAAGAKVRPPRPAAATTATAKAGAASAAVSSILSGGNTLLGPQSSLDNVIIGLGASTGGTEATLEVMKQLPADIPGMVIVQHMPPGFTAMYAERLNRLCKMEVREAKNGDEIRRGLALVAPADFQAKVVRNGNRYTLSCAHGEKVSGHRPSVDVLFRSMAENVSCKMVGIILTGMGQDGADGLLTMRKRGAYTIGQDEETSVVYGMPMVAHKIGAVITQAPIDNIAQVLLRHLKTL
ncbi:MAG: chemotaxis response regulator protein-glutamate methylesterase [Oscillospiraceae bacterium]|nr:chemotaxis response regulator protein-glutamate methylesterase [Oscillospiraceae bacterium]